MKRRDAPLLKFGVFAVVMVVASGFLVLVFGQYRSGDTAEYSAIFTDSSGLRTGDTVRVAGVEVGRVHEVSLRDDHRVRVEFDADRTVALTGGTKVSVRYLNLVGDRYLELIEGPGSTEILAAGTEIPVERTASALDLDLLLGGLKPVIRGLNAHDVNGLTWSLLEILQGKQGTLNSLLSKTSSFTATLASNSDVVERLIDHLNTVMTTLAEDGAQFSGSIDRLEQLVTQLAHERDPIAAAIGSSPRAPRRSPIYSPRRGRRWPGPSTSCPDWRHCSIRTRTCWTERCNGHRTTTANSCAPAPTAISSSTTSVPSRSG